MIDLNNKREEVRTMNVKMNMKYIIILFVLVAVLVGVIQHPSWIQSISSRITSSYYGSRMGFEKELN